MTLVTQESELECTTDLRVQKVLESSVTSVTLSRLATDKRRRTPTQTSPRVRDRSHSWAPVPVVASRCDGSHARPQAARNRPPSDVALIRGRPGLAPFDLGG